MQSPKKYFSLRTAAPKPPRTANDAGSMGLAIFGEEARLRRCLNGGLNGKAGENERECIVIFQAVDLGFTLASTMPSPLSLRGKWCHAEPLHALRMPECRSA